jgi:hypothetical protein
MIIHGKQEIIDLYHGALQLIEVYHGKLLIYKLKKEIDSCFGNGYWINNLPWLNTDGWKN